MFNFFLANGEKSRISIFGSLQRDRERERESHVELGTFTKGKMEGGEKGSFGGVLPLVACEALTGSV